MRKHRRKKNTQSIKQKIKKKKNSDCIRQKLLEIVIFVFRILEIVVFIFGILEVHVYVCIGFNRIGIIFEILVLIE